MFEGVRHNYTPDFLVIYDEYVTSVWEIKGDNRLHDPKTIAKIKALDAYCEERHWNRFLIESTMLARMRKFIGGIDARDKDT